ncbi:MAG: hypothetical protein HY744_29165 [Deltaproteobacteria bacterium]|nr:hypothetical protein [Deltaproteobacteria bacterium]
MSHDPPPSIPRPPQPEEQEPAAQPERARRVARTALAIDRDEAVLPFLRPAPPAQPVAAPAIVTPSRPEVAGSPGDQTPAWLAAPGRAPAATWPEPAARQPAPVAPAPIPAPAALQPPPVVPAQPSAAALWTGGWVRFEICCDQGEQAMLRELSRVTGLTVSDVIRQAIRREHAAQVGALQLGDNPFPGQGR